MRVSNKKECAATGYSHLNIMATAATKAAYKHGEEWLEGLLQYLGQNVALLRTSFEENMQIYLDNAATTKMSNL